MDRALKIALGALILLLLPAILGVAGIILGFVVQFKAIQLIYTLRTLK